MSMLDRAVHAVVAVTVLSLVAMLFDGTLFAYHPAAMSIGFLALMSEGVLTALKFRRLEGQQRVAAIQTHLYIQAAATVAVTLGFIAIAWNKVLLTRGRSSRIAGPVHTRFLPTTVCPGDDEATPPACRYCTGRHTSRLYMERCAPHPESHHMSPVCIRHQAACSGIAAVRMSCRLAGL